MNISKSIKQFNTFGLDIVSNDFNIAKNEDEIINFLNKHCNNNPIVLGGGSNILFKKDIERPVLKIEIKGINVVKEDSAFVYISVGAGENWDNFVNWSLRKDYGGIENLSLIPGNVGSAPIQNIGAYGKEVKDIIYSCDGVFIKNLEKKTFKNSDCNFAYRSSIFKKELKNKFVITKVNFVLKKNNHKVLSDYNSVSSALKKINISKPKINDIAKIIKKIREEKLPDYNKIGNAGSFFKNPVLSTEKFEGLKSKFNKIPSHKINKKLIKVPAAWLIEICGFKELAYNNVSVHKNQSLVIINLGGAKGIDIYNFSQKIKESVYKKFDILLEEEVNII